MKRTGDSDESHLGAESESSEEEDVEGTIGTSIHQLRSLIVKTTFVTWGYMR